MSPCRGQNADDESCIVNTQSAQRTRRTYCPAFKALVALAAVREGKTLAKLSEQFELRTNQTSEWERHLLERAGDLLVAAAGTPPVDLLLPLHAQISQLTLENDFWNARSPRLDD